MTKFKTGTDHKKSIPFTQEKGKISLVNMLKIEITFANAKFFSPFITSETKYFFFFFLSHGIPWGTGLLRKIHYELIWDLKLQFKKWLFCINLLDYLLIPFLLYYFKALFYLYIATYLCYGLLITEMTITL